MDNKQITKPPIFRLLQDCDIFGVPISIKLEGKEKYKSYVGAVITFTIIIAMSLQLFDFIQIIHNYNVIFEELIVQSPSPYIINPSEFIFAIGIQNQMNNQILDESIYQIQGEYRVSQRIFNLTSMLYYTQTIVHMIDLVQCTPQHFEEENMISYFQYIQYENMYCLSFNQTFSLQGQIGSETFTDLTFIVSKCNTSTTPTLCQKDQIIENELNGSMLTIYYLNYSIDLTKDSPFQANPEFLLYKTGITKKYINVFFKNTFISTDNGLVFSQTNTQQRLIQSSDRQDIDSSNNALFQMSLSMERNKESYYSRSYTRLITQLSKLGGLFNFFYSVGILLCYPFSKILFRQNLLNSIFSFQNKEQVSFDQSEHFNEPFSPNKKVIANLPHLSEIELKIAKKNSISNLAESRKVSLQNSANVLTLNNNNSNNNSCNSQNINSNANNISSNNCEETSSPLHLNLKLEIPQNESPVQIRNSLREGSFINNINIRKTIFTRKKTLFKSAVSINDRIISALFNTTYNSFKVRFFDILLSYLCQKRAKSRMIRYGLNKLNYHLDINTIITKLLELEKLKRLLLNGDQIKLFEFIPKPIVHEEQFDRESITGIAEHQSFAISNTGILYEDKRSFTQKAREAEEAYHKITKQNKESDLPINRKLLQLIDPRISMQFEQNTFSKNYENFTTANLEVTKEASKEQCTPKSQKGLRSNFYSFNLSEINKQ